MINTIMENIQQITLTDNACQRVKTLLDQDIYKDKNVEGLRVYVTGGGCSGFNYGFAFEDEIKTDDIVIENNDVKVIVDPMSMMYIDGSTIDYETGLLNQQFVVSNPLSTGTCGCGSSFTV